MIFLNVLTNYGMEKELLNKDVNPNDKTIIRERLLEKMKIRYYIFYSICFCYLIISSYYLICFSSIYPNSSIGWLIGGFISLLFFIIVTELSISILMIIIRILSLKYKLEIYSRLETIFKLIRI